MNEEQKAKMAAGRVAARNRDKISHTVRTSDGGRVTFKDYRMKRAIRCFCVECLGWSGDPLDCTAPLCPLFPFRRKTLCTMRSVPKKDRPHPPPTQPTDPRLDPF